MGSILRVLLVIAGLVIVVAVLAVPIAASQLASNLARDAGFSGSNLKVSVDLLGPQLLSGAAPSVHLEGDDVGVPHGVVGHLDVTLDDVSLTDHTFAAVSGTLTGVRINAPGGPVTVGTVTLEGPSQRLRATGSLSVLNSRKLIRGVARDARIQVDNVQLKDGKVTLEKGRHTQDVSLRVAGNALVLDQPGLPSTVLVAPAPSEKWQISSVDVSPSGITVGLDVDAQGLVELARAASSGRSDRAPRRGISPGTRKWWNGRHASLRSWCPRGREGSSPSFRTSSRLVAEHHVRVDLLGVEPVAPDDGFLDHLGRPDAARVERVVEDDVPAVDHCGRISS